MTAIAQWLAEVGKPEFFIHRYGFAQLGHGFEVTLGIPNGPGFVQAAVNEHPTCALASCSGGEVHLYQLAGTSRQTLCRENTSPAQQGFSFERYKINGARLFKQTGKPVGTFVVKNGAGFVGAKLRQGCTYNLRQRCIVGSLYQAHGDLLHTRKGIANDPASLP